HWWVNVEKRCTTKANWYRVLAKGLRVRLERSKRLVELCHHFFELLPSGIHGDHGDSILSDIRLDFDLAGYTRKQAFLSTHDEILAWSSGTSRSVPGVLEELNGVVERLVAREARDPLFLEDGAAHFLAHRITIWSFGHVTQSRQ